MKLIKLKTNFICIPLEKPFITSLRTVDIINSIQIEIITDKNLSGFGAASPTAVITGDTSGSIEAAVKEIWTRIKDHSLNDWDLLMHIVHNEIIGNTSAKAAVDIALHDLRAKSFNIPLYTLLGGARTELHTDMTISLNDPEVMTKDSLDAVKKGFSALKIKLGNNEKSDLKRMIAINNAVGKDVQLRIDANQGWSRKEAVRAVLSMLDKGINIQLVEQPVKASDYSGLKYVTDNLPIPVLADESIFSVKDAIHIITTHSADWINIKLMKTGGIEPAMRIASIAEEYGINCMIGCMMEGPIGIAAAVHFGCGRNRVTMTDLDVPAMYKKPLENGFSLKNGTLKPANKPGLGLKTSIDEI